jgi:hypothetical protein
MIVSKLTNKDPIEKWRTAKNVADRKDDLGDVLGCVGGPIAEWLKANVKEHSDELVQACSAARGNLLAFVNDHRSQGAEQVLDHVSDCLAYQCDPTDSDLDTSDSLDTAYEKGWDAAANQFRGADLSDVTEIDMEGLG